MIRLLAACAIALAFAVPARTGVPCPQVSTGTYGAGCATQFDVPEYKASFDPANCTLTLGFSGFPGCCNTFLTARIVLLGTQAANIPVPGVGPGCTLLVDPTIVAVIPPVDGVTFNVPPLPPGISVQVFSQYLNQYTTFGVQQDFNMSNGVAIKLGM